MIASLVPLRTPVSPQERAWPDEVDARMTSEAGPLHRPVMVNEVLDFVGPCRAGLLIDATVGPGGHTAALLGASPGSVVIGLDRDPETLEVARKRLEPWAGRVSLTHADYRDLPRLAFERRWSPIRGIIADFGVSSFQLDDPQRGFSFQRLGPLDMRVDRSTGRTAAELVNQLEENELAALLRRYGDERHARRIAAHIVRARQRRPLKTTETLAAVVAGAVPRSPQHIHPATRTFQALRIAVNDELTGLYEFVVGAARLLAPGGRLVMIGFHSLEDRLVKQAFRYLASDCVCPPRLPRCQCSKVAEVEILTSRPLRPRPAEVEANPRARSARLRALERW